METVMEIQRRTGNTGQIQMAPRSRGCEAVQTQPNVVPLSCGRSLEREGMGLQQVGPTQETVMAF